MRDYKKSLDYLVGAYMPDDVTYDEIKEIDGENCAKHYMNLKKLVDRAKKYKWHDLRKNPDDLPDSKEIERIIFFDGHEYDMVYPFSARYKLLVDTKKIKAWKYIEPFEV